MKKAITLLTIVLFSTLGYTQTIESPSIDSKANENIGILKIEKNSYNTIIHFVYQSDNQYVDGGWFNINPEIKIKETGGYRTYKLIKAEGVKLAPEKTNCEYSGQIFSFRLIFPAIASDIYKFDIIECSTSNCFNFYGVSANSTTSSSTNAKSSYETFRRDYNIFTIYDNSTEEWGDWQAGDNTFVLNYGSNNDIAHYHGNGELVVYKRITGIEEGYTSSGDHYQILTALDGDGLRFKFQFFDDISKGLKLIYGDVMIQFAKQ